jgi:hypothetical protein
MGQEEKEKEMVSLSGRDIEEKWVNGVLSLTEIV